MAVLTTWSRIEPHAQTTDIDVGLAAEVADPLWFLLRQWQFGELRGDDGGAPVTVDVAASWSAFSRYATGGAPAKPLHADTDLLEAIVEREPVIRLDGGRGTPWTAALRAGRSLKRRLVAAELGAVAHRLVEHPSTQFTAEIPADTAVGTDDGRYRDLLANRVIDGAKVLALRRAGPLPAELVGDADPDKLDQEIAAWTSDMDTEWGIAAAGEPLAPAWDRERQEYSFTIAAPPLPGDANEYVLRATEYDGTGVCWDSLDRDPHASLGAAADLTADPDLRGTRVRTLLASPLTYPGMPADRYWEFEDAAVALGRVRSGPTDLARMLAIDFAVIYSPDWFMAPVEVPVGGVARVDWVVVRDTFGIATLIGTTETQASDGVGRQFQPSNLTGAEGDNPVLVVLPSALGALTSEPREEVALQRDEMANLAWSIEKTVMGPSGRPVPRPWFASDFTLPTADAPPDDYDLIWRLATRVAETWTPFVAARRDGNDPAAGGGDPARVLRRARILDTETTTVRGAKSLLMSDIHDLRDEEVTRAGAQLRMVEQLARTPSGRTVVWRGREKRSWRGEAASGLLFDAATPKL